MRRICAAIYPLKNAKSGRIAIRKRREGGKTGVGGTLGTGTAFDQQYPGFAARVINLLTMNNTKLVINANEISIILGVSIRQGQRHRRQILRELGKKSHQAVTYEEFSEYSGIPLEVVLKACRRR